MIGNVTAGLAIILVSGILNASFPLPMKYVRRWKWENTWLAFCTLSLFVLPLALARTAVADLWLILGEAPARELFAALAGGFVWGTAQVTFGIAIASVGMAMAFAIVVGMCSVLGSLFPMIVLHPGDLLARPGLLLMASAVILTAGLVLYARAARQREADAGVSHGHGGCRKGLAVCLYTGAAGGAINLGFAFSRALTGRALAHGATPLAASFVVWALVLPAGYLPNLVYCLYLLIKHRSYRNYAGSGAKEPVLAAAMAVLWLSGWAGYGVGATAMGAYGTSIGFAAYMTALLLWSTCLGVLTGEWRAASPATVRRMRVAVAAILLSVVVLSGGLG